MALRKMFANNRTRRCWLLKITQVSLNSKLIDLEDRSRRTNLRIYGITEMNNESSEKCEEHADQASLYFCFCSSVIFSLYRFLASLYFCFF